MHTVDTIMSEMMKLRVHIAPVGFEVDRIVIPATRMRADKVWLVVHDNPAEDKAHKYQLKIEKELAKKGIKTQIARANRLMLFPIIKAVKEIIIKERKNDIYVNVACGSKIHAIGCMMACMIFDKREHIHPFYAQADKYPEPAFTILIQVIFPPVPIYACALAPVPPPPLIVITGISRNPVPPSLI